MPLYLRFLFPLIGLLLVTDLALATHPGTTPHCPALDAIDPVQREALMNHVCFLSAAPDTPAHRAESPRELPADIQWTSARGHDLVFSHTDSVYWVRLNVRNSGDSQKLWYLKLNYPLLDEVTFWRSSELVEPALTTGDQHPFLSRGIDYRYFLLPVTLGAGETQTITLRIQSSGALNVPLSLKTPETTIAESNHLTLLHGFFYGALLVFAVFNLLLFFSSGTGYYFYNAFTWHPLGCSCSPWAVSPTSISGPTVPVSPIHRFPC